jgi:hypothetical protein
VRQQPATNDHVEAELSATSPCFRFVADRAVSDPLLLQRLVKPN